MFPAATEQYQGRTSPGTSVKGNNVMKQSVIAATAAIALTTLAITSAHAGPSAAGLAAVQKNMQTLSNQSQLVHKTGKKKKKKFIAGLIFGLSTAAAVGYSIRHERRCRRWERRCWNGSHRACWKFETRC